MEVTGGKACSFDATSELFPTGLFNSLQVFDSISNGIECIYPIPSLEGRIIHWLSIARNNAHY